MSATRERAVLALNKILVKARKPKDALEELAPEGDKRERAFLMELVYGVLRYRDYLDWMLRGFIRKPSGLSPDTLNNLRLAVYQIQYLRVPDWAVVNEAVEVEKLYRGRASVVNAVLRSFLRGKDTLTLPPEDDPVSFITITTSHPRWLVKRWVKRFGYDGALRLARANNEIPPVTVRVDGEADRERAVRLLSEKGLPARFARFSPSGIVVEAPLSFEELRETLPFPFSIQDEASQLISYLLNPSPGQKVLDACAAPGGKSTHMAKMMRDSGEVVAVEAEEGRIRSIGENAARLGLHSIRIIHGDAKDAEGIARAVCGGKPGDEGCLFDRILLDAPCSSLGVIRRNPDIKYRHAPRDLVRLRENQGALLRSAARLLAPGGIMVYSVCSTEPEEGEEAVRAFLHDARNFSIIRGEYGFLEEFESEDAGAIFYRTFPHKHGMDGFFAARLKKQEGEP
ncbi:MAG: 16S rRNA (cytosine(967)-C(5))-methyltransferase RsmB [Thermodesulfovibrionales bacterium]